MHVYKSLCKSVLLPFLSSKKLHATENSCLKTLMLCFLQGTIHCWGTPYCCIVNMSPCMVWSSEYPAGHRCMICWSFSPLEAYALWVLCLSHTLRSFKLSGIISSGEHFISYCPTMLSNFLDPASFSCPFKQNCASPVNLSCMKTVLLISSKGEQSNNGFPQHDNQYKLLVILNFAFTVLEILGFWLWHMVQN